MVWAEGRNSIRPIFMGPFSTNFEVRRQAT